jgi:hypothetical protein
MVTVLRTSGRRVLVTGMPRSGTSVLGHLMASAARFHEIWEPFNAYTRRGVPDYFPYLGRSSSDEKRASYHRLIDDTLRFRLRGSIALAPDDALPRRLAKRILGTSRSDLDYWSLRARQRLRPRPHVIVKDPNAAFLSETLIEEYGFSVVVAVRHPAALLHSYRSRGWPLGHVGSLLVQPDAQADLFSSHEPAASELSDELERFGLSYRVTYGYLRDVASHHPDSVTFVRHEDFCDDAAATIRRLLSWAGLPRNTDLEHEAFNVTTGVAREHRGANLADVQRRDARWARDGWREAITPDELLRVSRAAEPVLSSLYAEAEYA